MLALPSVFSLTAVAVLIVDQAGSGLNHVALALATATVMTVIVRMAWSLSENLRMLAHTRVEALTDALTGLGNRRQLMVDLDREIENATLDAPCILILFDLDGSRATTTRSATPRRRAARPAGAQPARRHLALRPRVPPRRRRVLRPRADGRARGRGDHRRGRRRAVGKGSGFHVTSSYGVVVIPREADTAALALQIADQRLYARKDGRPSSARRQSADVLLGVLRERQPDLHIHVAGVADLALAVGRRLGMTGEDLDELARAAELHDIGKVAIPETILNKPAALDAEEWRFMHKHTILGEKILMAAPALIRSRASCAPATSAGTAPATRTASPARTSPWAPASSACATRSTR